MDSIASDIVVEKPAVESNAPLDGPAPCDDCCQRMRCEMQHVACAAFMSFVKGDPRSEWSRLPRQVSRRRFERVFGRIGGQSLKTRHTNIYTITADFPRFSFKSVR